MMFEMIVGASICGHDQRHGLKGEAASGGRVVGYTSAQMSCFPTGIKLVSISPWKVLLTKPCPVA